MALLEEAGGLSCSRLFPPPRNQRSLGFGILASANAVGDMVSSLYVGTLLAAGRGPTAFAIAGTVGAAGALWVFIVGRSGQRAVAAE